MNFQLTRAMWFFSYYRLKWMSVQGTKFKVGCIIWLGHDEEEMPRFALVKEISIVQQDLQNLWLVTEGLLMTSFNKHVNAYEVKTSEENLVLVKQQDLPYGLPLHLITTKEAGQVKTYVCPKYQI